MSQGRDIAFDISLNSLYRGTLSSKKLKDVAVMPNKDCKGKHWGAFMSGGTTVSMVTQALHGDWRIVHTPPGGLLLEADRL